MDHSKKALERMHIVLGAAPVDFNDGATTGDYVSLKHYKRCLVVIAYGDGTAGSDLAYDLYQATAVAGTGAKVLNALSTGRIYTMDAATYAAYAALTVWTEDTQATADQQWADATNGEAVGICALEVRAEDLDIDGGFDCIRCDVSDPGAAKIGVLLYILMDPDESAAPILMRDPLVD